MCRSAWLLCFVALTAAGQAHAVEVNIPDPNLEAAGETGFGILSSPLRTDSDMAQKSIACSDVCLDIDAYPRHRHAPFEAQLLVKALYCDSNGVPTRTQAPVVAVEWFIGTPGFTDPINPQRAGIQSIDPKEPFDWQPFPVFLKTEGAYSVGMRVYLVDPQDPGNVIVCPPFGQGPIIKDRFFIASGGAGEPTQAADWNADYAISLSELLRVIQFFNIGGFHCADSPGSTEDGYLPGMGGDQICTPHDTDYAPDDWVISLEELLRVISFYNSGGYNYCPELNTEDGFCPAL